MAFTHSAMLAVVWAASLLHLAAAAAFVPQCKKLDIRREWRTLSDEQRYAYVGAIKCMTQLPSVHPIKSMPGIITRYDDFVAAHMAMAPKTHYVGQFLPWHRYFLLNFEKAIRNECDYDGPLPYWDWNQDVPPKGDWMKSPAFDPDIGFGGNGPYVNVDTTQDQKRKAKRAESALSLHEAKLAEHFAANAADRQVQQAAFRQAKRMLRAYHATKAAMAANLETAAVAADLKKKNGTKKNPFAGVRGPVPQLNFHPKNAPKTNSSAPSGGSAPMAAMPGMGSGVAEDGMFSGPDGKRQPPRPNPSADAAALATAALNDPQIHPPKKWLLGLAELGLDVSRGMPIDPSTLPPPSDGPHADDMAGMDGMNDMGGDAAEGDGHHHHPGADPGTAPPESMPPGQMDEQPAHFGGGCITDGPFQSYNGTLGPGLDFSDNPHCIKRDFMTTQVVKLASDAVVKYVLNSPDYFMLGANIDPLHEVGHAGIGGYAGNMANLWTSLTDPIFWLHHSNMDRVWWSWQMKQPVTRLRDIASPEINIGGNNITLDYLIRVGFTGTARPIRDIMDLRAWPWCRDYDSLYE